MRLIEFELKKLLKNRIVLLVCLFLAAANMAVLYEYDLYRDHSQNAQAEDYREEYSDYLSQIPEQAERLKKTEAYQRHDTFLYRNLDKTVRDYARLDAENLTTEAADALIAYSGYDLGIFLCWRR